MKKKSFITAALVLSLMSLTACGTDEEKIELAADNETYNESITEPAAETEAATEAATEAVTESTTEAAESTAAETVTEPAATEAVSETSAETEAEESSKPEPVRSESGYNEFVLKEGLSSDYADLDNRCFSYDGKIYRLGETTLQDMIDDGVVPFSESDLKNAGNNVNRNRTTDYFKAVVSEFDRMQFQFSNFTDDSIQASECVLSFARWYTIDVPVESYDDEKNQRIIASANEAYEHIGLSFPFDLTMEQMKQANPEPTKEYENKLEYTRDSEKYFGKSGYAFDFSGKTGQVNSVTISWLP